MILKGTNSNLVIAKDDKIAEHISFMRLPTVDESINNCCGRVSPYSQEHKSERGQ